MTVAQFDMRRAPDPLVDAPEVTPLEQLADDLGQVDAGTVTLLVDARPGWSVVYSLGVDSSRLAGWRRAAFDENLKATDEGLWHRTILAAQCREIRKDGKLVADTAGRPLSFFSDEFWRLLGVPAGAPSGSTEAVRKFYANDFAVSAAADKLLVDAGFGRQAREAPDPTAGSSSS